MHIDSNRAQKVFTKMTNRRGFTLNSHSMSIDYRGAELSLPRVTDVWQKNYESWMGLLRSKVDPVMFA